MQNSDLDHNITLVLNETVPTTYYFVTYDFKHLTNIAFLYSERFTCIKMFCALTYIFIPAMIRGSDSIYKGIV